ncbi:sigma-70 family RNA polymerase sigma factor [Alkalihalobacillus sp. LMS39]|uniref:sigma-70 family RNA polymerase sigma factor n=1 Tax=Alkalihalobacillus sp. LMS39 TaxID=2924032 RepID=UPI001FB3856B|nr:sigma-70 family RNA polymerase sigma factor [Alkalihalobacillus sp. LMS39]UOE95004.1 sigma-70 family RNA polymerase sigma factor [Alkalihalobacillus sp. LMS39]
MNELEQVAVTTESIDKEVMIDHLINEYSDGLLHLVYTYVKNRTTAEDLTQEIILKCYEKSHQFHQHSSLKTWAYRIAINHCKDYVKSWHYRKITLNEKIIHALPSKSKNIEEEVIAKSEEDNVTKAVMRLPIKYREIVFLHYYEELSLVEISNVSGVNLNTIKTRLKRAKELLKNEMKKEAY